MSEHTGPLPILSFLGPQAVARTQSLAPSLLSWLTFCTDIVEPSEQTPQVYPPSWMYRRALLKSVWGPVWPLPVPLPSIVSSSGVAAHFSLQNVKHRKPELPQPLLEAESSVAFSRQERRAPRSFTLSWIRNQGCSSVVEDNVGKYPAGSKIKCQRVAHAKSVC